MAKTTDTRAAASKTKAPAKSKPQAKAAGAPKGKQAVAGPPRQPGVERRKNHPLRAKDGHINVLLTQSVPHVGQPGELVVRAVLDRLPQGRFRVHTSPRAGSTARFWTGGRK